MRLRCARCGCYVHANDEGYPYLFNSEDVRVEPCARCLREAQVLKTVHLYIRRRYSKMIIR